MGPVADAVVGGVGQSVAVELAHVSFQASTEVRSLLIFTQIQTLTLVMDSL